MTYFMTQCLMPGVYWVEVPQVNLRVLCGCPPDVVKHLYQRGMIQRIQREGVISESGPNAILLSDTPLQNGSFCNMAEFPILQMLYLQGMLLPNHPANNGQRPLLIGTAGQVHAQMDYIHRGNYGLLNKQELLDAGASAQQAQELMSIKLHFAFGHIASSETLVKPMVLESQPLNLPGGVQLQRLAFNVFEFTYAGENVQVNLNLQAHESYLPSFDLPPQYLPRHHFAVVHCGEGDGWDAQRPAMASLIAHEGRWYLIDASPSVLQTLQALGLGLHEIEGVFHTHSHDDHFAGLTLLMQSERPLKYFAVPWVRESVIKKCQALMGWKKGVFHNHFEFVDLHLDHWNDIQGLLVRPRMSPHPVETTYFEFQVETKLGHKTYAHLADICSFAQLDALGALPTGLSAGRMQEIKQQMLAPADVKKIDIGGGLIHGNATDFKSDASTHIRLSHTHEPLNASQESVGTLARFAEMDVLWPAHINDKTNRLVNLLIRTFPHVPPATLQHWATGVCIRYAVGEPLITDKPHTTAVLLIVSGLARQVRIDTSHVVHLYAGSVVGETWPHRLVLSGTQCIADSIVETLAIPLAEFKAHGPSEKNLALTEDPTTWWNWSSHALLRNVLTRRTRLTLGPLIRQETLQPGDVLTLTETDKIYLLTQGEVSLEQDKHPSITLKADQFFGAARAVHGASTGRMTARALTPVTTYSLPAVAVLALPICRWKIMSQRLMCRLNPTG